MDRLDRILRPALAKKGLLGIATSAEVCFYAEKWGKIPFKPISFSRGILKVSVTSSSAASELHMNEEKLLKYINSHYKSEVVKELVIKTI